MSVVPTGGRGSRGSSLGSVSLGSVGRGGQESGGLPAGRVSSSSRTSTATTTSVPTTGYERFRNPGDLRASSLPDVGSPTSAMSDDGNHHCEILERVGDSNDHQVGKRGLEINPKEIEKDVNKLL